MQVLLLTCILGWAGHLGVQATPAIPEERSIIAAVLADLETVRAPDSASVQIVTKTELDVLHPWVRPNSDRGWIVLNDKSRTFGIPNELADSARIRNRQSLSLMGFELPQGAVVESTRTSAGWRVTLSRPGVSADGTRAIVAVTFEKNSNPQPGTISVRAAHGQTVYLEKREGNWRIVGRGSEWIT